MAGMNTAYLNAIANHGASQITHIGLVNQDGEEIEGGDYARQEVYWSDASDGTVRPYGNADLTEDIVFEVPEGATVAGWRGYDDASSGTNYGGADFDEAETYSNDGQFQLVGDDSGILHNTNNS